MKKIIPVLTASALILCGCNVENLRNLPVENEDTVSSQVTNYAYEKAEKAYVPLNYDYQKGEWIPYYDYEKYMLGKSEEEFRNSIRERFSSAKSKGINTVYLHIHPNGDVYYRSQLFPKGVFWDGDYDPLEIMLEEAHALGLSAHGWINPLRLQTAEEFDCTKEKRFHRGYEDNMAISWVLI